MARGAARETHQSSLARAATLSPSPVFPESRVRSFEDSRERTRIIELSSASLFQLRGMLPFFLVVGMWGVKN